MTYKEFIEKWVTSGKITWNVVKVIWMIYDPDTNAEDDPMTLYYLDANIDVEMDGEDNDVCIIQFAKAIIDGRNVIDWPEWADGDVYPRE